MSKTAKLRGERIAAIRKQKKPKITQAKLAELLGLEKNTIWRWEAGQSLCEDQTAERVAAALGCSLDDIIIETREIEPSLDTIANYVREMADQLKKTTLSEEEQKLLIAYRNAPSRTRQLGALYVLTEEMQDLLNFEIQAQLELAMTTMKLREADPQQPSKNRSKA